MLQTHLAASTAIIFIASFLPPSNPITNEKTPTHQNSVTDIVIDGKIQQNSDGSHNNGDNSGPRIVNVSGQNPEAGKKDEGEHPDRKQQRPSVLGSNQLTRNTLLSGLSLQDCSISQGELNHHKDWNGKSGGHVFATDIVCTPGETFKVQAPDEYPFYLVQHIGTDPNLGTYVILKHGETRFVLGHLENRLEAGSTLYSAGNRINAGDTVGWVNESGNSGGLHLHIEKWIGKNNVTMSGDRINEFSSKLCEQRGWAFCKAVPPHNPYDVLAGASEMIIRYEGFRPEAYWDVKGYSIGYGTPSFKGEKITRAEAKKRFEERLRKTVSIVISDFPELTDKQKIALVSLAYNCWGGYQRIKSEGIQAHKSTGFCLVEGYSGLEKRRAEESKLLFQ